MLARGREEARKGFAENMGNPKVRFKIIDLMGEGDRVASRWELTDGEKRWKGISFIRLVDGKIKDDFFCSEEIKPA
jgi:predicted ester cyclase